MDDPEICEENKKILKDMMDKCFADGLTTTRICKILYTTRQIAHYLNKPFPDATKLDIQGVVGKIERNERYSEWTKHDFKAILKKLYKWLKGNDETFPDEVRWVKPRLKNGKKMLPENILTEDEVKRMAEIATHPRDKAFVLALYESGCRIGEMLSLQLKNVQFDEFGGILRVSGKTGDRRVRVVFSAPAIATWLDHHPLKNDPEAYLWSGWERRYAHESFHYGRLNKKLKQYAEQAGIKRRIYPHLFRHSRATALASKLTEAQMKEHFGWVQSSDMASVYVHLSGRDVDEALLKTYGITVKEEQKKEENLKPRTCPRCKVANSPISKFCQRCGTVLDVETVYTVEEQRRNSDELMNKLMEDPEFKKLMLEKIAGMGLANKL